MCLYVCCACARVVSSLFLTCSRPPSSVGIYICIYVYIHMCLYVCCACARVVSSLFLTLDHRKRPVVPTPVLDAN